MPDVLFHNILCSMYFRANNNEPNFCLQKASENHKDDFGIRSLLKNVYLSAKSMKSSPETSTVFKDVHEDLGFTAEVCY